MIKADKNILECAQRYNKACVTRDTDYVKTHSIDDPENSFCGITTESVYNLPDFIEHLRGLPPVEYSGIKLEGWVEGNVAWTTSFGDGILPSQQKLDIRLTIMMKRISDDWKVFHFHVSESVARDLSK